MSDGEVRGAGIPASCRSAMLVAREGANCRVITSALKAENFSVSYAPDPYKGLLQYIRKPTKLLIVSLDLLQQKDSSLLRGVLRVSPDVKILLLVPEGRRRSAAGFLEEGVAGLLCMPCYGAEVRLVARSLMSEAASDPLTGLPNRAAAKRAFARERERADRSSVKVTLGFGLIDLDDFKSINTDFNYLQGDRVLKEATLRLRRDFRLTDVLARWGGEEFVVLLNSLPAKEAEARMKAAVILNRARARLCAEPMPISLEAGGPRWVTASGGLALYPHDGGTWDELFSFAEQGLKTAKLQKNRIVCRPEKPGSTECSGRLLRDAQQMSD